MSTYFIGVDLGTNGIKAGIIDLHGNIIESSYWETALSSNGPGCMEQNPDDFYQSTLGIIKEILEKSKIDSKNIAGIALDSQMGGVVGIDKDFNPVTTYDTALDTRSQEYNDYIHGRYRDIITKRTCGSPLYGPKIMWWKEKQPEIYHRIFKFVMLNGYVAGRMAGLRGDQSFIDYTLLSFSGISDAVELRWSSELCKLFDIDTEKLPEVVSPWKIIGRIDKFSAQRCGLKQGTPVLAGAGDQAVGLLGAGLVKPGSIIDVAGSSTLLFLCVDKFIPDLKHRAIMYIPSVIPGIYHAFTYINGGGISLRWFRDEFTNQEKILAKEDKKSMYEILEEKASHIPPGSGGLLFVPYFGGRQCPYDSKLRGGWIGLNWGHKKEHLYRAMLESIAYDYDLGLKLMKKMFPEVEVNEILTTGGGSNSKLWNQIKADVLGLPYIKLSSYEFALRGCGIIVGYGVGAYQDLVSTARDMNRDTKGEKFLPNKDNHKIYSRYREIYQNIFSNSLEKTFYLLSGQTLE